MLKIVVTSPRILHDLLQGGYEYQFTFCVCILPEGYQHFEKKSHCWLLEDYNRPSSAKE